MIPIRQSPLALYFDEILESDVDLQDLCLLDNIEATKMWNARFDSSAKGLFDLPKGSWVVQRPWTNVGEWLDAFNDLTEPGSVPEVVARTSGWDNREPLLIFQNKSSIISLRFELFRKYWRELLTVFDDGPILMSRNENLTTAFRFTPIGQILQTPETVGPPSR